MTLFWGRTIVIFLLRLVANLHSIYHHYYAAVAAGKHNLLSFPFSHVFFFFQVLTLSQRRSLGSWAGYWSVQTQAKRWSWMQQVNNWFCSCKPAPDPWANGTPTGELFNHGFLSTLSSTEIRWPNQLGAEQECDGQEERTSERILVNHTADQMALPSHRDLMIVWQRGEKM